MLRPFRRTSACKGVAEISEVSRQWRGKDAPDGVVGGWRKKYRRGWVGHMMMFVSGGRRGPSLGPLSGMLQRRQPQQQPTLPMSPAGPALARHRRQRTVGAWQLAAFSLVGIRRPWRVAAGDGWRGNKGKRLRGGDWDCYHGLRYGPHGACGTTCRWIQDTIQKDSRWTHT